MTDSPEIYARRRLSRQLSLWRDGEPADATTCLTAMLAELARKPAAVDSSDLLAALTLVRAARAEIDHAETALLAHARERGITWQALADAAGASSRQAVQQRAVRAGALDTPHRQPRRDTGTGAA
ncbi:DNA-binding protein [Pseudactinotalea suaedae]|uniref:DNA-binding protein n=1 Tax=Pseudactinotalea suaedae TaxID=1524924 RepID=UPI0012E27507|nr:DNA-binding protein [Pseudactinotalea suaedae]